MEFNTSLTYKKLEVKEYNLSRKEIEDQKLFNVFVFGLPRSGTSMMSGICTKLGVNFIHTSDTDEEIRKREIREKKRYGKDYKMNEDGFYEITQNLWENFHKIMATPFSGCKMIIPVKPNFLQIVKFNPCSKVIMMWRDPEEIRQSQQASYKGTTCVNEDVAEMHRAFFRTSLTNQKLQLQQLGIDTLHVEYQDILQNPEKKVNEVAEFLCVTNPIEEAIKLVNPDKNRFKKEELVMNI